jgi:predicted anti-sigma-YlaC factor YlaD
MTNIVGQFGKYILMVIIALLSFFGGSVTDIGQAFQIAINKDKAIAQAVEIINETPPAEIKDAVKANQ